MKRANLNHNKGKRFPFFMCLLYLHVFVFWCLKKGLRVSMPSGSILSCLRVFEEAGLLAGGGVVRGAGMLHCDRFAGDADGQHFPGGFPVARTTNVRTSDVLLILFVVSSWPALARFGFTAPNKIASGGLTGLATVLYFAIGTPIGTVVLIGNLILLGIQAKLVGTGSVWKTILSVVVSSVLTDLMMGPLNIAPLAKDPLLAPSCAWGILGGIGVVDNVPRRRNDGRY